MKSLPFINKLWPKRFLSQTILLVSLAFLIALGLSLGWQYKAHQNALVLYSQRIPLRHMATVSELLANSPPQQRSNLVKSWRRPGIKLWITDKSKLRFEQSKTESALFKELESLIGDDFTGHINLLTEEEFKSQMNYLPLTNSPESSYNEHSNPWFKKRPPIILLAELKLDEGQWLQMRTRPPRMIKQKHGQNIVFMLLASISVLLVLVWRLRKITRPLSQLAQAANSMGRGQAVAPVAEQGPEDIQDTVRAFNEMNARVDRFLGERTRMLAALSHDLRTPMTSMRLRLEMMTPGQERDKLLESLDEMIQMSEGTLSFIRDGSDNEPEQRIDIGALLSSLCDDFEDQGHDISLTVVDKVITRAKPVALKRAVNNLLENAIRYGESAVVNLSIESGNIKQSSGAKPSLLITIQDKGLGIPIAALQKVFDPFYRVESSRSRSTGGLGLGLSIARQLISAHGGDLTLTNTSPGLLVKICLPIRA